MKLLQFNKHDMDNFFTWGLDTDNRDSTRKSFSIEQVCVSVVVRVYVCKCSYT